jgi:hypothetical protein
VEEKRSGGVEEKKMRASVAFFPLRFSSPPLLFSSTPPLFLFFLHAPSCPLWINDMRYGIDHIERS